MLQVVLLAGKFLFLLILYLFVYRVVRSAMRELRGAAPAQKAWVAPAVQGRGEVCTPVQSEVGREQGTWALVVERSPCVAQGTVFPFPPGTHALAGRSPDMDIHLEDTFVSSKHALFESTPQGLLVEDLRSTNGTQVNGEDITEPRLLAPGDRIEVGDTVFRVEVR